LATSPPIGRSRTKDGPSIVRATDGGCNLWIDGLAPWEEFDLDRPEIMIGDVPPGVRERTERCKATTANPDTGKRDADTLARWKAGDHRISRPGRGPVRRARSRHRRRRPCAL
jgi:hypothetical protein